MPEYRLGFRIVTDIPRVADTTVAAFADATSSTVADAMGRLHFMDPGIECRSGTRCVGVAVTVNCRPGDNLMVHKALELATPGDVVVVSTNGGTSSAVFGELMGHAAVALALSGVVVDGAIRDVAQLRQLGFPVFSRAVTPGGCDRISAGEINVPVACGNIVVMPGDLVIGDEDGVAVVPRPDADAVLERVHELLRLEQHRIEEIERGSVINPAIDASLRALGLLD